jgi:peptidoglycan/LPS O-acetylase OafA/YrhL
MSGRETWGGRLEIPGIAGLATISYSVYLSHKLAFHAVDEWRLVHPGLPRPLTFALFAIAALIAALALHFLVEKPFLKLRDHLRGQRRVEHPIPATE